MCIITALVFTQLKVNNTNGMNYASTEKTI